MKCSMPPTEALALPVTHPRLEQKATTATVVREKKTKATLVEGPMWLTLCPSTVFSGQGTMRLSPALASPPNVGVVLGKRIVGHAQRVEPSIKKVVAHQFCRFAFASHVSFRMLYVQDLLVVTRRARLVFSLAGSGHS